MQKQIITTEQTVKITELNILENVFYTFRIQNGKLYESITDGALMGKTI